LPPPGIRHPLIVRPATARTGTWQRPIRLPPHESDIIGFGNPVCFQSLHFAPHLWQIGLTLIALQALNSHGVAPSRRAVRDHHGR
jgi:hypothetical protein